MKKILCAVIFISLGLILYGQQSNGYNISVSIAGLQNSSAYLAYHLGDKQYIKDTIRFDGNGNGKVMGSTPLPYGIYMIVLPENKYFELLISDDQIFALSCSLNDYFNTLKFTGSVENEAFLEYQKNWVILQEQGGKLSQRLQKNQQNPDSTRIISAEQKSLENKMKTYLNGVIKANNGNLLSVLVKALLPIEVPAFTIPPLSPNPDSIRSLKSYLYNKDHFFDNIDLTDDRLLRTPILDARLKAFFNNIVIPLPDSINREIDKLIAKCEGNYEIFQYVSVFLFNKYRESEIMGHDAVIVKLADDIYLSGKADWVSAEFKTDLKRQVDLIRPNLIGERAVNLVMNTYNNVYVSLYDINKEFTILYFWEPDCSHCQTATPILKEYYEKVKNDGIEVFAICTQSDKAAWEKYIAENKLSWINGWDPERITNFDYYFNIQSTPLVYILDKDKNIIAKKIGVENIGSFIEDYRKYNK